MSNMLDKLKQKMEALRDSAEGGAVNMLPETMKATENVIAERWEICQACEHLYKPTHTCKVCGCFMKVKTSLAGARCPKNKWLAVSNKTTD